MCRNVASRSTAKDDLRQNVRQCGTFARLSRWALAEGKAHFTQPLREVRMNTLQEAFEMGLQEAYYAERSLLQAMPQLMENAESEEFRAALQQHEQETQQQVEMLEQVFQTMGVQPQEAPCQAVDGLIADAQRMIGMAQPPALDAVALALAQANEHFEITKYGTLVAWARELGRQDVEGILQQILDQEKQTDQKLTQIAESMVNQRAQQAA